NSACIDNEARYNQTRQYGFSEKMSFLPGTISASNGARVADLNRSPSSLQQAMHRLIEVLEIVVEQIEASPDSTQVSREELNELEDYGIQLLANFIFHCQYT
ncbi:MAG: hypothetical protein KZQ66_14895, partial [Candidatus Thiodiazotropha sp. (ex Lucinoma aequizonata)]|nr:hypothetical protein [Candidatus Thiodiazotropha sp. (ex Lucinoma aequizonata)]MCU7888916.1 hypothetical protein [Candidatus Thiodiazotropha sp. (ex Lucinoma aequizonata)]MCU7897130.1 hypothetical protein [Candidatus Thiodiazotropha sp. (ex Lucinoma aequizonata)]MCU7897317.1 hypothetical protein [Candidatus Thiodiazotropha sp. (ex Lucinoma aequizonata)]MCU7903121.1 hypothetical protein [Candidatus Thiodiazotropha sp. (ex Lucinoma aequizonata)]